MADGKDNVSSLDSDEWEKVKLPEGNSEGVENAEQALNGQNSEGAKDAEQSLAGQNSEEGAKDAEESLAGQTAHEHLKVSASARSSINELPQPSANATSARTSVNEIPRRSGNATSVTISINDFVENEQNGEWKKDKDEESEGNDQNDAKSDDAELDTKQYAAKAQLSMKQRDLLAMALLLKFGTLLFTIFIIAYVIVTTPVKDYTIFGKLRLIVGVFGTVIVCAHDRDNKGMYVFMACVSIVYGCFLLYHANYWWFCHPRASSSCMIKAEPPVILCLHFAFVIVGLAVSMAYVFVNDKYIKEVDREVSE